MDILYLLIPLSTLLVLFILGFFAWALHSGQFDELDAEGMAVLDEQLATDAAAPERGSARRLPGD